MSVENLLTKYDSKNQRHSETSIRLASLKYYVSCMVTWLYFKLLSMFLSHLVLEVLKATVCLVRLVFARLHGSNLQSSLLLHPNS